jgi:EPS-associated MarR family transcriptional regulator
MKKKLKVVDLDIRFRILNLLEEEPQLTQRELSKKLGISLGGVNFCLRALITLGFIKIENFSKNPNKAQYLYLLTPQGFSEKAYLTSGFLKRKMVEYLALKKEIKEIKAKSKKQNTYGNDSLSNYLGSKGA